MVIPYSVHNIRNKSRSCFIPAEFPCFYEHMSGWENLRLHCEYMGYHTPGSIENALEMLGLLDINTDRSAVHYLKIFQVQFIRQYISRPFRIFHNKFDICLSLLQGSLCSFFLRRQRNWRGRVRWSLMRKGCWTFRFKGNID